MGRSYHFAFSAPGTAASGTLYEFLLLVETEAKALGFSPTIVVNAAFKTQEERAFARRLTSGVPFEHELLRGVTLLAEDQIWHYDRQHGSCRLIPNAGVVLVVTDEHECETVFGFLRFPSELVDTYGRTIVDTNIGNRWFFRNFVNSPDQRFRLLVQMFARAGFLEMELDEFTSRS